MPDAMKLGSGPFPPISWQNDWSTEDVNWGIIKAGHDKMMKEFGVAQDSDWPDGPKSTTSPPLSLGIIRDANSLEILYEHDDGSYYIQGNLTVKEMDNLIRDLIKYRDSKTKIGDSTPIQLVVNNGRIQEPSCGIGVTDYCSFYGGPQGTFQIKGIHVTLDGKQMIVAEEVQSVSDKLRGYPQITVSYEFDR
jgi:hypothetical protein